MITFIDIRNSVIALLREKTVIENITGEDVEQARQCALPLLHVQVIPVTSKMAAAGYQNDKSIMVDIAYMEDLETSNENLYKMLDLLDGIFKPYIIVRNRVFTIENAEMSITDDIGHYMFLLNFTDTTNYNPNTEPLAENLRVEFRKE